MPESTRTIEVVDQTIRDGPQSLYTEAMNTMPPAMVLRLARELDGAGFHTIDFGGWVKFERLVKAGLDPWQHLRDAQAAAPNTRLRWGLLARELTFGIESEELCDFAIDVLVRNGMSEFWLFDTLFKNEVLIRRANAIKRSGGDVFMSVMYTLSPVHTDEYYARNAAELAGVEGLNGFYLEDTAGALLPERAASLVGALRGAIGDLPLEAHFHDFNGFGVACYLEAIRAGATTVHTAVGPLGGGGSLPAVGTFLRNLGELDGAEVRLDRAAVARAEKLAWHLTRLNGLPSGGPREYDASIYRHQLPGGMKSSLERQLLGYGMAERIDEVLVEMARIRVELGYPVMATPLSQFVGVQAVMNVMSGERYRLVPDELCLYLHGHYGPIPGPVDPEVLDKVAAQPRYRELGAFEAPRTTVAELRQRLGTSLSDEELMLRHICSEADVRRMRELTSAARVTEELEPKQRNIVAVARRALADDGLHLVEAADDSGRFRLVRLPAHGH